MRIRPAGPGTRLRQMELRRRRIPLTDVNISVPRQSGADAVRREESFGNSQKVRKA